MDSAPVDSAASAPRQPDVSASRGSIAIVALGALLSVASAWAAGNAPTGERIYAARCLGCHGDGKTTGTIGPLLAGIIGRKAASGESGAHSRALVESGVTWDEKSLRKFLSAPATQVPGTVMPVTVPPEQIDDLLAYLRVLR
ncbi:MAG TPA: c-type cytochrome [Burkholderiales bacterium]|nr:c-type cytochrome [Burkholderiales bacterium]